MNASGPSTESLRDALRALAEADATAVLGDARGRARARATKLLEDELFEELLAAVARLRASETSVEASPRSESAPSTLPDISAPSDTSAEAWWTYCVLAADDAADLPAKLEGIEPGSSVEVVCAGELAALVSRVPADEYDDVRLRAHLEDLAWVERTARRHEAVLEETLARVTIVPLRLCTLYRDVEGVTRLLRDHAEPLAESLAKVAGCAEWGVKAFAHPVDAADEAAGSELEPGGETPGAAYLTGRRHAREQAQAAGELRARCAEAVHERISACARESISNPPQRPELHGRDMAMVLNGAYLVRAERAGVLHDAVRALQEEWGVRGFVVELTGPWPAYNFVASAAGVMR